MAGARYSKSWTSKRGMRMAPCRGHMAPSCMRGKQEGRSHSAVAMPLAPMSLSASERGRETAAKWQGQQDRPVQ